MKKFAGYTIIGTALLLGVGGLVLSLVHCRWDTAATLFLGLVGAGVVWWQGTLIKRQIQFQSFIELDKEWNSPEMVKTRENTFDKARNQYELYKVETILEFLEKLASFRHLGVLDMRLLEYSNIGWYAVRYFFFNRENIETLRKKWKDEHLYEDLRDFYEDFLTLEVGRSKEKRLAYEKDLESTRDEFIKNESRN